MSAKSDFEIDDWAERSALWNREFAKPAPKRAKRERNPAPLILCGHGVSLRIENGALVIRDGFTHYPQEQVRHRYFRGDLDLPQRILLLDGSGTLSFDVLSWLAEQGVVLARVTWSGEAAIVASGAGYAADRAKVEWQRATREDGPRRLAFAADLIGKKLSASFRTLERHIGPSQKRELALRSGAAGLKQLEGERFDDMKDILAIEAQCASAYFTAWHGLSLNWKGIGRHPIPNAWRAFSGRPSLANGLKPENRNASHPINAMLNYAYAVKVASMQITAVAEGYDPTFGIMHNGRRGKPAFILDLVEPERPKVDASVLDLIGKHAFSPSDFVIRTDGSCRLSPQLARMVASLAA